MMSTVLQKIPKLVVVQLHVAHAHDKYGVRLAGCCRFRFTGRGTGKRIASGGKDPMAVNMSKEMFGGVANLLGFAPGSFLRVPSCVLSCVYLDSRMDARNFGSGALEG